MQVMRRHSVPDTRTPAEREENRQRIRDMLIAAGAVEVTEARDPIGDLFRSTLDRLPAYPPRAVVITEAMKQAGHPDRNDPDRYWYDDKTREWVCRDTGWRSNTVDGSDPCPDADPDVAPGLEEWAEAERRAGGSTLIPLNEAAAAQLTPEELHALTPQDIDLIAAMNAFGRDAA